MIPYSVIKEVNPDEVKGCATGAINFLVFVLSGLVAPAYGWMLMKMSGGGAMTLEVFTKGGTTGIAAMWSPSSCIRETGAAVRSGTEPTQAGRPDGRECSNVRPAVRTGDELGAASPVLCRRTIGSSSAREAPRPSSWRIAPMLKQADATRVHATETGTGATRRQLPHWIAHLPPCNAACPAGENIQAWLEHARAGRWQQAWKQILDDNPFPASAWPGLLSPLREPVQSRRARCRRRHSRRRAPRRRYRSAGEWQPDCAEPTGHRVLIVGAGPAGLSCAYHLARLGHAVEVREATEEPGGMMRWGIPEYRLPRDVVHEEIARITAMGVKITCGQKVEDVLAEKQKGGFDAVFLAVGAQAANRLEIPAADGRRLIDGVTLLGQTRSGTSRRASAAWSA